MKISQLYVYPIKSLRGAALTKATLTPYGVVCDRRFMLLRDWKTDDASPTGVRYQNMHVSQYPALCLFTTAFKRPDEDVDSNEIIVTHTNPDTGETSSINVAALPDSQGLKPFSVKIHQSPTTGLEMPSEYSDWFSARFGFDVVFVYLAPEECEKRPVLGTIAPNAATRNPKMKRKTEQQRDERGSWSAWLGNGVKALTGTGDDSAVDEDDDGYGISFADCAPFLIVSQTSCDDVSRRFTDGSHMDITKFRPNIIVEGADEAWEEDYWGEVTIKCASPSQQPPRLNLTTNCLRCRSLDVDYQTGDYGKGETGKTLSKLSKDRRIDTGHKYSPAFGRYGFLVSETLRQADAETAEVSVGDEIFVSKKNEERTTFRWPGLGQTAKTDLYPV